MGGTKEFLRAAKEKISDESLIGQFGVGFFSSFLVSKEVVVRTTSIVDKKSYVWRSTGNGSYSIEEIESNKEMGTSIELVIKEEDKEFLEDEKLKMLAKKYNSFVGYDLFLHLEKEKKIETPEKNDEEKEEEAK